MKRRQDVMSNRIGRQFETFTEDISELKETANTLSAGKELMEW